MPKKDILNNIFNRKIDCSEDSCNESLGSFPIDIPGAKCSPPQKVIINYGVGDGIINVGNLIQGDNIILTGNTVGRLVGIGDVVIEAVIPPVDLSNYYTKTELQTSGSAQVHWNNITDVPSLSTTWSNITGDQSVVGNAGFNNNANYITLADLPGLADVAYSGNYNDLINTPVIPDLTGYATEQWVLDQNYITGVAWDQIAGSQSTVQVGGFANAIGYITLADVPSQVQVDWLATTGVTSILNKPVLATVATTGDYNDLINQPSIPDLSGYATEAWVLSQGYISSVTSSWNVNSGDLVIQGETRNLDGRYMLKSNTLTAGYGISASSDFLGPVSISVNTSTLDSRYLRKDSNDDNGSFGLTLGTLSAGNSTFTGSVTLSSVGVGTGDEVLLYGAGGVIQRKSLSILGAFGVANSAGTKQFDVDLGTNLRFQGAGDTSISFNSSTNTVIVNSVPGSGTGGAVTSFNGRDGAVNPALGDYTTTIVGEGTNQYFTQARVRSTPMTGLPLSSNAIVATDALLTAIGKAQGQINVRVPTSRTLAVNGTAGNVVVSGGTLDLSANRSWTVNLATVGTAGTYSKVTTDSFGRVSSGGSLSISDLPNIATQRILGRGAAGSGNIQELTLGANLSLSTGGVLSATDTNTTYSAGSGLTLSGTEFSMPVTISGSGTYVQSVAQNTNGITVTLGTPPNTTYSLMSASELNTGTATTSRLISAERLNTWLNSKNYFVTPNGTAAQYITGTGSLATFPTIPTVNNGTLTLSTGNGLTGSTTFTANQSSNTTFTVGITYGTGANTAAQGNDSRINNGQTAYGWGNPTGRFLSLGTSDAGALPVENIDFDTYYQSGVFRHGNSSSGLPWGGDNRTGVVMQLGGGTSSSSAAIALTTGGTSYNGHMWFRNRPEQTWYEVWHDGNFNPSDYAQLGTGSTQVRNNSQLDARYLQSGDLPTVNNGTLTLATGVGLMGSASFTANQAGNSAFAVAAATGYAIPTTTQISDWNSKVPASRTINGKVLSSDVTLSYTDVGAINQDFADNRYILKNQAFSIDYREPTSAVQFAGDFNDLPLGSYTTGVSTLSSNRPHVDATGGFISFGSTDNATQVGRIVTGRTGDDAMWYSTGSTDTDYYRIASREWVGLQGYLTNFTETDPTVPAHVKAITSGNISNWNTAFGWGDYRQFGLGGNTSPSANVEALTNNRFFATTSASVFPYGVGVHMQSSAAGTRAAQIHIESVSSTTEPIMRIRATGDAGWSPIRTVWHDGNFTPPVAFTRSVNGLVPAPGGSGTTRYLREDGSWTVPDGGGGGGTATDLSIQNRTSTTLQIGSSTGTAATVPIATTSLGGLMTAADKVKLNAAITDFTETDPTVPGHVKSISSGDITSWNEAYSNYLSLNAATAKNIPIAGTLDFNNLPGGGVFVGGSDSNTPDASNTWAVFNMFVNSSSSPQMAFPLGGTGYNGKLFWRARQGNPWLRIWHEGNLTGAATTILSSNLTANHVLLSNSGGKVAVSPVTSVELGYMSGVTSNIQTQLNVKFNNPSGSTSQYIRGDGSLATFPSYVPTSRTLHLSQGSGIGITNSGSPVDLSVNRTWTISLANMPANTIKGKIGALGTPEDLTGAQVRSIIGTGTSSQYMRGDGSLATFPSIPPAYTLPVATATVLGGIELFSNTVQSVAANAVTTTASRTYGIQLNSAGQAVVNVPWTNISLVTAGDTSVGALRYNGTTRVAGQMYGGTSDPVSTTRLNYDGTLHVGNLISTGASDIRLKENIERIPDSVEKLSKLGGYSFKWKEGNENYKGQDYGVLAQEVEKVLPEIVVNNGKFKSIKNGNQLIGLLIEGFNALRKRVEELENGIS